MLVRHPLALPLILLLFGACGSNDRPGKKPDTSGDGALDTNTAEPEIEPCDLPFAATLGTGPYIYTATTLGADVEMVHGHQGGWHLDIAADLVGVGKMIDVLPTVTLRDGIQIAGDQLSTSIDLGGEQGTFKPQQCAGTFYGERAYIDDHVPDGSNFAFICSLEGQTADVELQVTDVATGETIHQTTEWILHIDVEEDAEECAAL